MLRAAEEAALARRKTTAQSLSQLHEVASAWMRLRAEVLLCTPAQAAARRSAKLV